MMQPSALHVMSETSWDLFQSYAPLAGVYDEMFAAPGLLRPAWVHIGPALAALGLSELARRWEQAQRLMYDHGVTYNVYGDPQGLERPWQLDPIPLVIASSEWDQLETALVQRAQLFDALLADVYGPQKLLAEGVLPPELVFAHPGFLRPCHNLPASNGRYLHLYAADLSRAADGQWYVMADRVQSPAGAGYALENRLLLSRTLPDIFRDHHVQRLAPFFSAVRQMLLGLAPRHRDNPRIVLLTPGPANETYFEQAYLARYLGYPLVEGGDLTVRDNRVYLKTLAGLLPVDVILRRQDDSCCDPLELRQDSTLGTAGLVQAVRAGNVVVVNALGSGWLETPAIMPFLPRLCRHLCGAELQLPSVPTWWCGQAEALTYVLDHVAALHVRPAWHNDRNTPSLNGHRQRLAATLRARPFAFVAQEPVVFSTVPVWGNEGLQPRHLVWRVYVAATGDGYTVMPGGLTRVSATPETLDVSMQRGGGSKDTWVLARGALPLPSQLPLGRQPIELRRSGYDLPSRVADNMFWLGRYVERAEGAVRLLRSVLSRLMDESGMASIAALPALLRALQDIWDVIPATHMDMAPVSLPLMEQTLLVILFDPEYGDSVRATLTALHRVAAQVRDRISVDSWRSLNHLEQDFTRPQPLSQVPLTEALELLNRAIMTLAAFSGLGVENMTRGPAWRFLDMGRRLERARHTTSLLRSLLVRVPEYEGAVLETLLEIADSSMTYRARYLSTLQCAPVLDLLLTDDTNPRSVAYQLLALAEHVEELPRDRSRPSLTPAQRLTVGIVTMLRLVDIDSLCVANSQGSRPHLDTLLTRLRAELPALSETITHHYLSHAQPSRHLALSDFTRAS
jgi:uncharacterized circularly permuted ATP-grasp superfamily protein/uncharacterized alpha-E superfamily protein